MDDNSNDKKNYYARTRNSFRIINNESLLCEFFFLLSLFFTLKILSISIVCYLECSSNIGIEIFMILSLSLLLSLFSGHIIFDILKLP